VWSPAAASVAKKVSAESQAEAGVVCNATKTSACMPSPTNAASRSPSSLKSPAATARYGSAVEVQGSVLTLHSDARESTGHKNKRPLAESDATSRSWRSLPSKSPASRP